MLPIALFILVGAIFYWIIYSLLEKRSDRKFNYSKYVQNVISEEGIPASGLNKVSLNLKRKIRISKDKEDELEKTLRLANSRLSPRDFYMQKFLYPLILIILFLLLRVFTENNFYYLLAVASAGMYFMPNLLLKQRIKYAAQMRRNELPSYLTPLGLLLFTFTPYQAVQRSLSYAGPFLRPYVERLIAEIEMYPGSNKPFENFSNSLQIAEAQSFVAALQQAFETDPSKSRKIISSQINLMRQMRTQTLLTKIETQPLKLTKFNLVPVIAIVAVVFTIVFSVMTSAFK